MNFRTDLVNTEEMIVTYNDWWKGKVFNVLCFFLLSFFGQTDCAWARSAVWSKASITFGHSTRMV